MIMKLQWLHRLYLRKYAEVAGNEDLNQLFWMRFDEFFLRNLRCIGFGYFISI
jgi:hypothetical protein